MNKPPSLLSRRRHDAAGRAGKAEGRAGDRAKSFGADAVRSRASADGALGGAAARWQGLARLQIIARGGLGMGLASPSEQGLGNPAQARFARQSGVNPPAATKGPRKPLAPPGAPFPLARETEKGTGGAHAEPDNRAAERWLGSRHSGAARRASPESISAERMIKRRLSDNEGLAVMDSGHGAGAPPRNDRTGSPRPSPPFFHQPLRPI